MCSADHNDSRSGWPTLVARFFPSACHRAFGETLAREGFSHVESDDSTAVLFVRGSRFIQFSCQAEDYPAYSPVVSLGFIRTRDRNASEYELDGIGLWRLIPDGSDYRSYGDWTFSTEGVADRVLARIRDEILRNFLIPAINDPKRLSEEVQAARSEIETQHQEEAQTKLLGSARRAFEEREFALAAELYGRVHQKRLTPADRKRFDLASRQGGDGEQ